MMDRTTTIPCIRSGFHPLKIIFIIILISGLAAFPFVSGNRFYISLITEMMIFGLLACLLAGIAGALFILYKGYIGPSTMSVFTGAGGLMMVLLGGMGSLWGSLAGAAIFIYIQAYISTMTEHWEIYLGLVVIFLVLFLPTGFAGLTDHIRRMRKE